MNFMRTQKIQWFGHIAICDEKLARRQLSRDQIKRLDIVQKSNRYMDEWAKTRPGEIKYNELARESTKL